MAEENRRLYGEQRRTTQCVFRCATGLLSKVISDIPGVEIAIRYRAYAADADSAGLFPTRLCALLDVSRDGLSAIVLCDMWKVRGVS